MNILATNFIILTEHTIGTKYSWASGINSPMSKEIWSYNGGGPISEFTSIRNFSDVNSLKKNFKTSIGADLLTFNVYNLYQPKLYIICIYI